MEKGRNRFWGIVSFLGVVFLSASCMGEEIQSDSDDAVTNDLESAQKRYESVLDRILYDTGAKEKQLEFNRAKTTELEAELKARQEFLRRLPKESAKRYAEMKRAMRGMGEKDFTAAAQKLGDDYETISEQTSKEISEIQADLAEARQRQFTLEPEIKVTALRKELTTGALASGAETDGTKEVKETGLEKLERLSSSAMQEEVNRLEQLQPLPAHLDDPYRSSFFNGK